MAEYWEDHYRQGGISGIGSLGEIREWKWQVIQKHAGTNENVIDVGCGDLSFWHGRKFPKSYVGIDISETIIRRNRELKSELTFICSPADEFIEVSRAKTVICLDVLFHIMNDHAYERVLTNLTRYSLELIIVYTWWKNPFRRLGAKIQSVRNHFASGRFAGPLSHLLDFSTDGVYQKYRRFEAYFYIFERAGFRFISMERREETDEFGAFYIFKAEHPTHTSPDA